MKFLKLRLDDLELYNVEGTDEKSTFLYNNMPAFRRLYSEQGETFWVRHLVTFREYFYVLIRAKFQHQAGQCLHWIITPMEKTFIRIHKLLFAGGFESAKQNLKIMKKHVFKLDAICPLITNSQCRLIASSSVKGAYKALFGSHLGHDKIATIKAFLASGLYKHFCGSLGVLLKRCDVAIDVPSMFDDDCPNMQYWAPFAVWSSNKYQPDLFENYISHYYGDRLSKMLMTTNIHRIFQNKYLHSCCEKFINDYSTRLVDESEKYQRTEYMRCEHHAFCYVRIVHSDSCKNPYMSCLRKGRCSFRCDTDCIKRSAENKSDNDYWKPNFVTIYPGSQENCRDIQTLAETEKDYRTVETYIYHTVDYGSDWNDGEQAPCWRSLPPDLMNIAKQIKRKEKTKSRLRDKLSKKAKEIKREDHLHMLQMDQLENWESFEFRSILFGKAQRKFRDELGDDLLRRMLTGKIGNTDDPLLDLFEEKLEMEYLLPRPTESEATKRKKKFRSIGVGCDVPLDVEFLPHLKKSHIKERLAKQSINIDLKSPQEMTREQKSQHDVLTTDALEEQKKKLEEKKNGCTDTDKNSAEIEHVQQKTEASTKEKNGPRKSKKNGKKNQKTNNEKPHSEKIQTCSISEDCPYNGYIYKNLTIKEYIPHLSKPKMDHLTEEEKEEAMRQADIITKLIQDVELDTPGISRRSNLSYKRTNSIVNGPDNRKLLIKEYKPVCAVDPVEKAAINHGNGMESSSENKAKKDNSESKEKSTKLRICGQCEKQEPARRTFKKCKLCKEKGSVEARYYCSKECQITDWKRRHEADHQRT